jgi:hypothetical protein
MVESRNNTRTGSGQGTNRGRALSIVRMSFMAAVEVRKSGRPFSAPWLVGLASLVSVLASCYRRSLGRES